jgi:hypothetical protein
VTRAWLLGLLLLAGCEQSVVAHKSAATPPANCVDDVAHSGGTNGLPLLPDGQPCAKVAAPADQLCINERGVASQTNDRPCPAP